MAIELVRCLPGRVRLRMNEIRNHPYMANYMEECTRRMPEVVSVTFHPDTARALILFDEQRICVEELLSRLNAILAGIQHSEGNGNSVDARVAATIEREVVEDANVRTREAMDACAPSSDFGPRNPYLLPTVASGGLLAMLAIKRMFLGRWAISTSPVTFFVAAGVSVVAGYPVLRSGVEKLIKKKRPEADLWLGLLTMSMGALRENLVALSVITIVNAAMYRRRRELPTNEETQLSPKLARHGRNMTLLSLILTPATLLVTRSPLKSMGVALGLNPRPAITAYKYRWAKAEEEASKRGLTLPQRGSLATVAESRDIVLTDSVSFTSQEISKHIPSWRERGYRVRVVAPVTRDEPMTTDERMDGPMATDEPLSGTSLKEGIPSRSDHEILDAVDLSCLGSELESDKPVILVGNDTSLIRLPLRNVVQFREVDAPYLAEIIDFAKDRAKGSERELRMTKTWNVVGAATAILAAPWMAPLVGLTGDVVSALLLALHRPPVEKGHRTRDNPWIRERIPQRRRQRDGEPGSPTSLARTETNHRTDGEDVWHAIPLFQLYERFFSTDEGLSSDYAGEAFRIFGANALPVPTPPRTFQLYMRQFKELSTVILMITAVALMFMGEHFSALSMMAILALNAGIATWQEKKSLTVIQALQVQKDATTKVVRDGVEQTVLVRELVPGDVVVLEPGVEVPADLRLIESWNLQAVESTLTGESTPVSKHACDLPEQTALADRENMLFMGTSVSRGRGKGMVVATGLRTQMGKLEKLLLAHDEAPTFLQTRVTQISKRFVVGAFVAAGVVITAGLLRRMPPFALFISAATLAASAIPEGLPLTITVALTAGIRKMSKQRAVVKKLANLESLGRVTVICCDKTGTLTDNQMSVMEIATVSKNVEVRDTGEEHFWDKDYPMLPYTVLDDVDFRDLLTTGMLCNNAHQNDGDNGGDPTELALLRVATKANLEQAAWKRHLEIPFDSETRSMSVVCEETEQANVICEDETVLRNCRLFSKGAVEAILRKCTHYQVRGRVLPMSEEIVQKIRLESLRMADEALRVLAFAYRVVGDDEIPCEAKDEDLVYIGLMGMMDRPKEGVAESIQEARKLGIKPVMITGDHPLTARAVGLQLGLYQPDDGILTGPELDGLSSEDLDRAIPGVSIFARVSPEHKLRIVQAYQRLGEVVAMTGDGVNDAPAIRRADVGIAMGQCGADIAKGTAGVVLMEDHFHSIVDGVKSGRIIIGNIRKAIGCLLAGNLAEVLVTALSIIVGLPIPLIPLQILLMNILTDAVPAMVLATGADQGVADKPYEDVIDNRLYRAVMVRGLVLGVGGVAIFAAALWMGLPLPLARTMIYVSLVVGQVAQLPAWRRYGSTGPRPIGASKSAIRNDKILLTASVGSIATLLATVYVPGIRLLFNAVPLGVSHWIMILGITVGLAVVSQQWIAFMDSRPSGRTRSRLLASRMGESADFAPLEYA